MTKTRSAFAFAALVAASLGAVAPAHAQFMANSSSTYIGGNVSMKGDSTVQAAIAIGDRTTARADQEVVYEATYIKGNLTMDCKSTVQAAIAIGNGSDTSAGQCNIGQPKH